MNSANNFLTYLRTNHKACFTLSLNRLIPINSHHNFEAFVSWETQNVSCNVKLLPITADDQYVKERLEKPIWTMKTWSQAESAQYTHIIHSKSSLYKQTKL